MGSVGEEQPLIAEHLVAELASSLKTSTLLTPLSEGYTEKIKRWADSSEKHAGAILLANSTSDISTILHFSQTHSLDLAVRGGGHSTSGSSSSHGGLVIDLSPMRAVAINSAQKTATVQGGCLWSDVDSAAAVHGLATIGGTVNHTGVGGLTLGGGYGWLCGQHGLTIDNLLSVQMVLASGVVTRASRTENTDLFWAVRGAGQSFGVVTEFVFRLHEQRADVWAGQLLFTPTPETFAGIVAFANHLFETSCGREALIFGFVRPEPVGKLVILALPFFNGPEGEAREYFGPLLRLGPLIDGTAVMLYPAVNCMLNAASMHGGRKVTKGAAYARPLSVGVFEEVGERFEKFLERVPRAGKSLVVFEDYAAGRICEMGNEECAFANRGVYGNAIVMLEWAEKEDDAVCRGFARELARFLGGKFERDRVEGRVEREGVGEYPNSDGLGYGKDSGMAMFGANYPRLAELKRKYDPRNVFRKNHLGASIAAMGS